MKLGCSVAAIEVASMYQAFLPLLCMGFYSLINRALIARAPAYADFSDDQRRCTIIYIMELVVTTVALGFMCAAYNVFFVAVPAEHDMRMIAACATLIASLYIFEVLSRPNMRWSLRIHHLAAIGFFFAVFWALEDNYSIHVVRGLVVEGMSALTEQPTFFGMVLYRFEHRASGVVLRVSAVQTLLTKVALMAWMLYYVVMTESALWYVIVVGCSAVLFPSQLYGAWAVWQVGVRADRRGRRGSVGDPKSGGSKSGVDLELGSPPRGGTHVAVPTESPCASPDFHARPSSSSSLSLDEEAGPPALALVPAPKHVSSPQSLRKQAMLRSMPSTRMV